MQQKQTKVVIIGGGFGGIYTAMALEKLLKRDSNVEVALISKENYLVFQPMLPEVISGSIGLVDTIAPIRRLCPRTNLYTREVESIDLKNKVITTASGFRPRPFQIEYDHLVLALGNVTSFAGQPGLAEHALPFKYLGDALVLRNHVIHVLEEADVESDRELRRALLTFVVAGGGFSGVEVVAELNDFVRSVARNFRHINAAEIRVVLLHAGTVILPELSESLGKFAQKILTRRGVEIRFNTRLTGATGESALVDKGEAIPTKTLVSTVPAAPNPVIAALPLKKERGRVVVNKHLEAIGCPGVWALGDCAWVVDHENWQPCPPTAQHATRQAACLANNLVASLHGKPQRAFSFKALGKLASLGHHSAVAEVFGFKLSGFFAWLMWRSIYLMKFPGLDRKIRVASDWFLDLLLAPDIVQLKLDKPASLSREHFEPGQIIFRERDRGDRLYIVVEGEVEMLRQDRFQHDQPLARLRSGECFGEMALVNDRPRMATARAVTKVNLLSMDRATFNALFATHPPLRQMFQTLIDTRLHSSTDSLPSPYGETQMPEAKRTQA